MKKILAILVVITVILGAYSVALATSTNVSVVIDSTNIDVAIPLNISITAKLDGGDAITPKDYKITNNSAIPIQVSKITVALNDTTDWAIKETSITAGTAPTNNGVNDIYMSVNGQVLAVQNDATPETPDKWKIDADGELSLAVEASTSKLDQTTTETNLITITYTIAAQ